MKTIFLLYDAKIINQPFELNKLSQEEQFNIDVYSNKWFPTNFDKAECAPDYHLHIEHLLHKYYPEMKIQYITLDEIGLVSSFIYPINFKFFHLTLQSKNLKEIFEQLLPEIQQSITLKKGWLLINDSHEYATYLDVLSALNSIPDSIKERSWITSSNLDNQHYVGTNINLKQKLTNGLIKQFWKFKKPSIDIFGFRFFEEVVSFQIKNFYSDYTYETKFFHLQRQSFKTFICLNNIVKPHRVMTTFLLYQNGLYHNFISQAKVPDLYQNELKNFGWAYLLPPQNWGEFKGKLPIKADNITAEQQKNPWNLIPFDLVNQSFFWLVTETLYEGTGLSRCFFTEKIYKPISLFMPFVVVAQPFTLHQLQKDGYQTFSKWWDESYDLEVHPQKRMEKIIKVAKFISNKSNAELLIIYQEMEAVLKHNYSRLLNTNAAKPFIDNLVRKYVESEGSS